MQTGGLQIAITGRRVRRVAPSFGTLGAYMHLQNVHRAIVLGGSNKNLIFALFHTGFINQNYWLKN